LRAAGTRAHQAKARPAKNSRAEPATALAFQLPVLQLLLAALGLVRARAMLAAWRWVVLIAALAGAVLTPSTDPVTMLLLTGAITALYLVGVGLASLVSGLRPAAG